MLTRLYVLGFHVQVVVDSMLAGGDWNAHIVGYNQMIGSPWQRQGNSEEHYLLIGTERWHHLLFEMEAKPKMFETDTGPLDAKV